MIWDSDLPSAITQFAPQLHTLSFNNLFPYLSAPELETFFSAVLPLLHHLTTLYLK
ncbi:hypothetical protein B0H10DRAFT_2224817 [Mycena sp. CBHHK59/15]|nr:hypothetical protein B0H10DRAFT_2224817 [Mycena sp. CBHHK59/15]